MDSLKTSSELVVKIFGLESLDVLWDEIATVDTVIELDALGTVLRSGPVSDS